MCGRDCCWRCSNLLLFLLLLLSYLWLSCCLTYGCVCVCVSAADAVQLDVTVTLKMQADRTVSLSLSVASKELPNYMTSKIVFSIAFCSFPNLFLPLTHMLLSLSLLFSLSVSFAACCQLMLAIFTCSFRAQPQLT